MAESSVSLTDKSRLSFGVQETEELEEMEGSGADQLLLPLKGRHSDLDEKQEMLRQWLISSDQILDNEEVDEEEEDGEQLKVVRHFSEERCCQFRTSGTCFCKLFVVVYLMACLLVSALYVAIYGPNELYILPETSPTYKPTINLPPVRFYDNPYTEWVSQKWTYHDRRYSDWFVLPDYIDSIRQLVTGRVNGEEVIWLLDTANLYFVHGFGSGSSDSVHFMNLSSSIDLNVTNETRLVQYDTDSILVLSSEDIILLNCSVLSFDYCDVLFSWEGFDFGQISATVLSMSDKTLWIGTNDALYSLNLSYPYRNENSSLFSVVPEIEGPVLSLAWRAGLCGCGPGSHTFLLECSMTENSLHVSTSNGGNSIGVGLNDKRGFGLLAVGTATKLYLHDGERFWFEWVSDWGRGWGGVVDGPPVTMTFVPTGELYIGTNISINRLNTDYTFDRIGPMEGLPYNNIISLHYTPYSVNKPPLTDQAVDQSQTAAGTLFIGTLRGYALYDVNSSSFVGYHYGPRWLPGDQVGFFASLSGGVVLASTENGLGVVRREDWTLERKAAHYLEILKRHRRKPGLVADCPLNNYTSTTCQPTSTDNDGLWTSWLVSSEAFRYQVTQSEEARISAWSLYQGLKFLVQVTGIDGLPARSVLKYNNNCTNASEVNTTAVNCTNSTLDPGWHISTSYPGWIWEGDTSSDEIVGHVFAYTVIYDFVAITETQRNDVASTLDSVIGYICNNNFTLVGIDNRTTRWGVWSPNDLNFNQSWSDERGLNSLEILSSLLSAYRITKRTRYMELFQKLFNGSDTHYGLNMINQKITFPRDINYSDDELAFLPYFVYFHTIKSLIETDHTFDNNQILRTVQLSMKRTWSVVKKERSSAWNAIYSYSTGENSTQLLEDIVWSLRTWPIDLVQWQTTNSHRLDIQFNSEQNRFFQSHTESLQVLPCNERTQLRWNQSPYRLDYQGTSNEMDPGPWLLPYWLARWIKLL